MDISVFAVIGGDRRSAALAAMLAADGYTVYAAGLEKAPEPLPGVAMTDALTAASMAQAVILPVMPIAAACNTDGEHAAMLNAPLSEKPIHLDDTLAQKLSGREVYSGMCGRLRAVSPDYDALTLFDYGAQESFLLPNARLTAEAAVMLAVAHFPSALYDSRCLVTGYGRIGKALSQMLYALGSDVTVCARRASGLALAATTGCHTTDYTRLVQKADSFDIIFNTADAMVINADVIGHIDPKAVIFDLASAPWGTDDSTAQRRGITVMHCPGLPGKYSPLTAAKIIKDTVLSMTGGEKT